MKPNWRTEGDEPDYRFTLANERTFLAWTRTGLALVAGAVALDQFGTDIAPHWVVTLGGIALSAIAAYVLLIGYTRWRAAQKAMRRQQPLPLTRAPEIMTGLFVAVAGVSAALMLVT